MPVALYTIVLPIILTVILAVALPVAAIMMTAILMATVLMALNAITVVSATSLVARFLAFIAEVIGIARAAPVIIHLQWSIGGDIGCRLAALDHRGIDTRKCAVAIGSRDIYPSHHHLIHQQIGTPAQKLRAFFNVAAVARRIVVNRLRC
jgi:hypothetical protein